MRRCCAVPGMVLRVVFTSKFVPANAQMLQRDSAAQCGCSDMLLWALEFELFKVMNLLSLWAWINHHNAKYFWTQLPFATAI